MVVIALLLGLLPKVVAVAVPLITHMTLVLTHNK